VKALVLTNLSNAALFDERYPDPELPNEQLRDSRKLLVDCSTPSDRSHTLALYCSEQ
jgi:hypothetical protein